MSFGIDYANVDGNKVPNLDAAITVGLSFLFIRGSWDKWADPAFQRDAADARKHKLPLGAYIGPDIRASAPSPEDQVKTFALGAPLVAYSDLPPVIDIEFPQGIKGTGMTLAEITAWVVRLIAAVVKTFGCLPIVYSSARVLDGTDTDCLAGAINQAIKGCPFWLTSYVRGARQAPVFTSTPGPRVPAAAVDAGNWWIDQDQGDSIGLPGFSSTVDIDQWNYATPAYGERAAWLRVRLPKLVVGTPTTFMDGVKAVQAKYGLTQDAIVGPRTFIPFGWTMP